MKLRIPSIFLISIALTSCDSASPRLRQFQVQGERLYEQHCSNCHQPDGSGLASLYPPLRIDTLVTSPARIACAVHYGVKDTLEIGGKIYRQPMAALERLTDLEIAEIITFLSTRWGTKSNTTEPMEIRQMLQNCR